MSRRLRKLIILGGVSVLLSIAGSGAAWAQGTEQGSLVVDTTNQHVFAASGAGATGVDVYDLDGTKLTTLDAPNASGLTVLSGTLWATPCQGDTIYRFDLATLAAETPVTIAGLDGACQLTTAGGKVWAYHWSAHKLISISANGTVTAFSGVGADQPYFLTGLPGSRLVESTTDSLIVLDVSTATPTVILTVPYTDPVWDVEPFGSTGDLLVTAAGTPRLLAGSDLHEIRRYQSDDYAMRSAAATDVSEVATVIGTGVVGFPAGSTQATLREPHGGIAIAFGPGDRLYLLLGGLTVINDASLRSSQVSVLPTTYSPHVGQPMGIYGALTFTNQSPTGARTLDVSADGPDGAHADLGQITTAADGTYTGEVSIPSPGGWTITVTYPGDGTHRPSHASTEQIQFSLTKANLQVALSSHVITYGHTITLTITLDAWHTNTVVELSRVSPGSTRVDMGPIDLGSDGTATLTLKPGRNTTYRAVWAGDDWYYPLTSNQPGVNVYAVVEDSLSGGYATQGGVRLYHYQTACPSSHRYCPIMNGTVIPNHAGKSIVFLIQMHTSSGWKNAGSGTLKIPSSGTAKAILIYKTRAVIGVLQRFRAVFPGDADHLKAYGPWRAFKITN